MARDQGRHWPGADAAVVKDACPGFLLFLKNILINFKRLEHACHRGHLNPDEWASFLRQKLTQLARRHGFVVQLDRHILIIGARQGPAQAFV